MKGVRVMKGVWMASLTLLVAFEAVAQGNRAKATRVATASGDMETASTEKTGFWQGPGKAGIRVPEYKPDDRFCQRVEFVDARGQVVRIIERAIQDEVDLWRGRKSPKPLVEQIKVSPNGRYVMAFEATEHAGTPSGPWWTVRYYTATGRESWSAPLCTGGPDAVLAEDGSVVALLDVAEGQPCDLGEDQYPAPPGCVGLRIYTAEGEEVFRADTASEVQLSPRGGFALVRSRSEPTYLVDLGRRKRHPLPRPREGGAPWEVDDAGVVDYYRAAGWPPGTKGYRFVPGKGLEHLPESSTEKKPER